MQLSRTDVHYLLYTSADDTLTTRNSCGVTQLDTTDRRWSPLSSHAVGHLRRRQWPTQNLPVRSIDRVKWRHSNLWSRYDIMLWGMMLSGTLAAEDTSRYLNKTDSVGLRKSYCYSARSRRPEQLA